jgi:hypothetical protein
MLNVPIQQVSPADESSCNQIKKSFYQNFLVTTAFFIHEVADLQTIHGWTSDSPVYDKLAYLQALWASRSAVRYDPEVGVAT